MAPPQNPGPTIQKELFPQAARILSALEIHNNLALADPAKLTLEKLKMDMIVAYGTLHCSTEINGCDRNEEWVQLVQSGEVRRQVTAALGIHSSEENWDQRYITAFLQLWEQSLAG